MINSSQHGLILDAESTLLAGECLDLLGNRLGVGNEIEAMTARAMVDGWDFGRSLEERVSILIQKGLHRDDLEAVAHSLQPAPSVAAHRDWFAAHADRYLVMSGGFEQCIDRSLAALGIPLDQRYANRFIIDEVTGLVTGFDRQNLLSKAGGKALLIQNLGLNPEKLTAVGDGKNDQLIKLRGMAKFFGLYIEVTGAKKRADLVKDPETDKVFENFSQVVNYLQEMSPAA